MIETVRLLLRVFVPEDVEALAPICADPNVMRFYPEPWQRDDVDRLVRSNIARQERRGHSLWAVIHRDTGRFVGLCGLHDKSIDGVEEIEVGYILGSEWWGQGLGIEAARASRDFGFANLAVDRLISLINPLNTPSIRVAVKNGMTLQRELVLHGLPTSIYAVTRSDAA